MDAKKLFLLLLVVLLVAVGLKKAKS